MNVRVGFGFDVHRLEEGDDLIIGGVHIPHEKGAVGHSDADVLLHAITDAILGAAGKRDIGFHFPDTDMAYKGADSRMLLAEALKVIANEGWKVGNVDATICLQRPKLKDHIPEMQRIIATLLEVGEGAASVKATTTEKLGFVGTEQGISAYAVALIHK